MTPTDAKAAFADLTSDIHNWLAKEADKVLAKMTPDEITGASKGGNGEPMRFLLAKALLVHIGESVIPNEYGSEGGKKARRIVKQAARRP